MSFLVGIDAVDIARMRRMLSLSPQRFGEFAWTEAERLYCNGRADRFATRWAAKEACMKALGVGFAAISPRDIEVVSEEDTPPQLRLHGTAQAHADLQGVHSWALSLTHENALAIAMVIGTRKKIDV